MAAALIVSSMSLSACRRAEDKDARQAVAELRNSEGAMVGQATFEEVDQGVRVVFEGYNLPPGTRGIHIHEVGQCDPPSFESAGDHFNPTQAAHGLEDPAGPHAGDLPNLVVAENGTATLTAVAGGATLETTGERSLFAGAGTALVIHEGVDDQRTDPAGDSGPRIACGVIRPR
jgi:superoxide dismutase, Cu-Zn family